MAANDAVEIEVAAVNGTLIILCMPDIHREVTVVGNVPPRKGEIVAWKDGRREVMGVTWTFDATHPPVVRVHLGGPK